EAIQGETQGVRDLRIAGIVIIELREPGYFQASIVVMFYIDLLRQDVPAIPAGNLPEDQLHVFDGFSQQAYHLEIQGHGGKPISSGYCARRWSQSNCARIKLGRAACRETV